MISLKKHLDNLSSQERLTVELEAAYQSALESIAENLPSVSPDLVAQYRQQIRALAKQFEREPTLEVVNQSKQALSKGLQAFGTQADKILENKDKQFKEILRSFAEAATTLAEQSQMNDRRLTNFTQNLDVLIGLQDLSEIRRRLVKEVGDLRQAVTEMRDASQMSVMQLRAELRRFQAKLVQTEEIARTDSLTGLGNRRTGEQALRSAIARNKPFCVVLMDLNGFKGINDRFGHQAGDALLKEFAARLVAAVRTTDMICRWGGDEFLLLIPDCLLAQATARCQEFRRACEGEYRLALFGSPITILLRTAQGVVEWQRGNGVEELLRRADERLYRDKGKTFAAIPA